MPSIDFRNARRHLPRILWDSKVFSATLVSACLTSCFLRDLDDLTSGGTTSAAGGNDTGSTSSVTSATSGAPAYGGSTGVAPAEGAGTTSQGGSTAATNTEGTVTVSGGTTGTTLAAGGSSATLPNCPEYVETGGTLVTPPTNGFEDNLLDWGRTSSPTSATGLSLVDDPTSCEGARYLYCDGAYRTASWDGPAIELRPFMQNGHKYALTAAVRFDAKNPPSGSGQTLGFAMGVWCGARPTTGEASQYTDLQTARAFTDRWVRVSATFDFPPSSCTAPNEVTKINLYFQTPYGVEAAAGASIHVDDFRLIDLTGAAGAGGAPAGLGGSAGAGSAGEAGIAGGGGSAGVL